MLEIVDWVGFEVADIGIRRGGKIPESVETRVLLESKAFCVLESAKVPKNLWYGRSLTENLSHECQNLGSDEMSEWLALTFHNGWALVC
jgi:hypothetical protein